MMRVIDNLPQHLISATDADDRRPVFYQLQYGPGQSRRIEPAQIFRCILATRQEDDIGMPQFRSRTDVIQGYIRFVRQAVEIGEIGNLRHLDNGYLHIAGPGCARFVIERNRIFFIDTQLLYKRDNTQHGFSRLLFQEIHSWRKQGYIATEFIDDETFYQIPFLRLEQFQCTYQCRQRSTTVDIGHEQDRCPEILCNAHIDDIMVPEIDFCRAARSFDDNRVILVFQPLQRLRHSGKGPEGIPCVIVPGRHIAKRHAIDDYLGAAVPRRLQQDRIHIDVRFQAGRLGLCYLSPPHFQSLACHV